MTRGPMRDELGRRIVGANPLIDALREEVAGAEEARRSTEPTMHGLDETVWLLCKGIVGLLLWPLQGVCYAAVLLVLCVTHPIKFLLGWIEHTGSQEWSDRRGPWR